MALYLIIYFRYAPVSIWEAQFVLKFAQHMYTVQKSYNSDNVALKSIQAAYCE